MKRTDLIIFIDSINEEHSSISTIKKLWNGPHLYAEYRTILDQNIKSNVVIYSGISNPKKFSYGVKKNKRNIIKSYVFHDHEKIDEQSAGTILDTAKTEGVDILTTEKDLARLLNSPKGSKREMLFLNSKVAKIDIIIDEEKLMNILVKNINIKLSKIK
jgi:tetraacyldisaccharide 4'-kinase